MRYEFIVVVKETASGATWSSDVYDVLDEHVDALPSQDDYPLGEQLAITLADAASESLEDL